MPETNKLSHIMSIWYRLPGRVGEELHRRVFGMILYKLNCTGGTKSILHNESYVTHCT